MHRSKHIINLTLNFKFTKFLEHKRNATLVLVQYANTFIHTRIFAILITKVKKEEKNYTIKKGFFQIE